MWHSESERWSEIKIFVLMKWKNKVDPNILIHIYGNLLIINWQNADHEYISKSKYIWHSESESEKYEGKITVKIISEKSKNWF